MTIEYYEDLVLHDYEPSIDDFKSDVLERFRQDPKSIPSKYLYDDRGSKLFREITALDEYYPTRTEITILRDNLSEIARSIGPKAGIIEFGTGAGLKTRLLLRALFSPAAYIPIDIAREQLLDASSKLSEEFPDLEVWPVCADYTEPFTLPEPESAPLRNVVFFPGSTIGNFTPEEAKDFLLRVRELLQGAMAETEEPGGLLIGVDLVKDTAVLNRAYNDARGVTAAFNLNLIDRLAREFETVIDRRSFEHLAFFNEQQSRIEMHLIAKSDQTLYLEDEVVRLHAGEHIVTEYSYKYQISDFSELLEAAGFSVVNVWTDEKSYFALFYAVMRADF